MQKEVKQKKENVLPSLKSRKIKIKVIGLGGGGASIISEMAHNLTNVNFLVADTDQKTIKKVKRGLKVMIFGDKVAHSMGTGMDTDLAFKAAISEKDKIQKVFQDQDLSILVGSLGGGVASGAGPVFAEVAKNARNISLGIFTLPFEFEGEKKMKIAKRAISQLQENLSGIIVVPNEKILHLTDKKMPMQKALSFLDTIFSDWLSDLISVILKPSLINIDFADLKTILKDRKHQLFFSQVEAQGLNRAEEVVKKIFQNPIFDTAPKGVNRILFNITGGKDLKLKEVELISKAIAGLNQRAKIVFGISENPKYKGKIKIILLAVSDFEKKEKQKEKKIVIVKKKCNGKKKENKKIEKKRRSAIEVKKAEEKETEREWETESKWDVPAFLRNKKE